MSDYTHHPLEFDRYFHIYNRGINGTKLFNSNQNNEFFMQRYKHYIEPVAETFAWCLMVNHFHLLVKIRKEEEIGFIQPKKNDSRKFTEPKKYNPVRQFAHLFDSYTKSFNHENKRTGGLFETPFRRILIENDSYLQQLICYIHYNPVKHGMVERIDEFKWSSFKTLISEKPTNLKREMVIGWFGSVQEFIDFHKYRIGFDEMENFAMEDDL